VPVHEFGCSIGKGIWSYANWFVGEIPVQIVRQGCHRIVAFVWILLNAFRDNRVKALRTRFTKVFASIGLKDHHCALQVNKVGAASSKTKMTQTFKPALHSGLGPWKRYVYG
jgi:hypothetical protein